MSRVLAALLCLSPAVLAAPPAKIDYDQHVKPILAAKCFSCHGATQQQSGLRLDLRQNALRGGDYGIVIVPGKSADSKLIVRLTGSKAGLQMPPAGALPAEEIEVLRAWIDQGAEMPGRNSEAPKPKTTDPKTQALLDIIYRHDLSGLEKALKADPSSSRSVDAAGSTALMHAAYGGTLELMQALLSAGANVTAANDRQATALHWAVADPAKIKLLIGAGADLNAKTVEGRTALFLAAMQPAGSAIVQILLDAGADPNAATLTGATALFPATGSSIQTVRLLLAKGADVNATTKNGATALMSAALKGPEFVALLLTKGADARAATKRGETALANAASHGDLESAKLLLAKGADVNATDYRGYTPLMYAAYCDNAPVELIRLFLEKGANANASGDGETALTLAAKRGETETTRLLRQAQKGSPVAAR